MLKGSFQKNYIKGIISKKINILKGSFPKNKNIEGINS